MVGNKSENKTEYFGLCRAVNWKICWNTSSRQRIKPRISQFAFFFAFNVYFLCCSRFQRFSRRFSSFYVPFPVIGMINVYANNHFISSVIFFFMHFSACAFKKIEIYGQLTCFENRSSPFVFVARCDQIKVALFLFTKITNKFYLICFKFKIYWFSDYSKIESSNDREKTSDDRSILSENRQNRSITFASFSISCRANKWFRTSFVKMWKMIDDNRSKTCPF